MAGQVGPLDISFTATLGKVRDSDTLDVCAAC